MTAFCEISHNKIKNNRCNGLIVMKDSNPTVKGNTIIKNEGMGILIKDKSVGVYTNNTISDNELDVFVERRKEELDDLKETNAICGDVRIQQGMNCVFY